MAHLTAGFEGYIEQRHDWSVGARTASLMTVRRLHTPTPNDVAVVLGWAPDLPPAELGASESAAFRAGFNPAYRSVCAALGVFPSVVGLDGFML